MKQNSPLISIVVLNWNGLEDTKVCLEHLKKVDYPNYEIIVVDNGSTDGSKAYLSNVADIKYVDNPRNRGFTGGHIDGLKHCDGEFVVLLNNDAVIKKDYITVALRHFRDPLVGAVGGRSYWWNDDNKLLNDNNPFYSFQDINIHTGEAHTQSHDAGVIQEVNNVSGSCVMVRRSVINEVGYLYNRFFAYFEETDLFARMKRAGYMVLFDPNLQIWHKNGASSGASEGSHFFYYQIFRNRFIFATRNFENKFLVRFWYIYAKLSLRSFAGMLKGTDKIMNRAYVKAAFHNFFTLPYTLMSRLKLRVKLGKSTYNHKIFSEQSGTSIVVDCSSTDTKVVNSVVKEISLDSNPLHEYVLVVKSVPEESVAKNVRFVVDAGYFEAPAINLGCIVARFPWMLISSADDLPSRDAIDSSILHSINGKIQLLAFKNHRDERASYLFLQKSLFERVGGISNSSELQSCLSYLIDYVAALGSLRWLPLTSDSRRILLPTILSKTASDHIKSAIKFDSDLLKSKKIGLFGKLQNKYYRVHQFTSLVKWIFTWRIPIRLKLGRIKNIVRFSLSGKLKLVAVEIKHMRNEVLIYGRHHNVVTYQRNVIKLKLKEAMANPECIPVFIVCFERVDALKKLTSWLEQHNVKKIVYIDNDSTYPPLLEFYKTTKHQVLHLNRNIGQTAPWSLAITRVLVPEDFYVVTDPDIIPIEECPKDFMKHFLNIHEGFPAYQKVGFGLKTDDLPDFYPLKNAVVDWEKQFWLHPLGNDLFEAGLDTTFALYKPFVYKYILHPSIRTGGKYVARHLPWYDNPAKKTPEDVHYRNRLDPTINSWNVEEVPERYQKELDNIDN